MSNKPSGADERSVVVTQLIAEFMSRTDAGEVLDASQFAAAHPEHAEELKQHFANVDLLEGLKETGPAGIAETMVASGDADEILTGDAAAHTVVRGAADSETSVTRAHEQQPTGSATSIDIPGTFGRYAIQKVLGQGAMGAVYLAKDTQLDRDVALKIPKFGDGNGVDDEELLARFYREARASATLRSPNICPVYDVGEIDGQHYITMAYIEGRPLKDFTNSKKSHSEKQIITTIRKLALGLAEAHSIGVIHRDLKPANIMVDRKGEPVVMDFGLARRSASDDVQVTQSGAILGTPAYMSPEQVAGDQTAIDHRADIYALGVIMYELITGEMPFKGSLMAILQQIALNSPTKPSDLRSDIDPRLEKICLKMMAGDQSRRYQSMTHVANDLQKVLRNPGKRQKKEQAKQTGPKATSIPSANEESNPALISIEQPRSYAAQLREKESKWSGKPKSKSKPGTTTKTGSGKTFGPPKRYLIAAGMGGMLLLLGIIFLVRVGKYDVQITLDDPSMSLRVDGKAVVIEGNGEPIRLSAGEHTLHVEMAGFESDTDSFTVKKDGKNAVHVARLDENKRLMISVGGKPDVPAGTMAGTTKTNTGPSGSRRVSGVTGSSSAPPPAVAPFDAATAKAHQEAWAKHLGLPVEYENSIGMKFRLIPPGEFLMGSTPEEIKAALEVPGIGRDDTRERVQSEAPQHKVVLTQPFYVGATEVTQSQYERVMGTNPSHFSAVGEGRAVVANLETGNHPVETVSWNDAAEFCAKLSRQEELIPFPFRSSETVTPLDGTGYRLPTEAEWESACRAGTTTRFWSGDEDQDLVSSGWYRSNSGSRTHPAGELKSNPFGLSDMHGNVWEWVQDSWDPAFYGKLKKDAAINPFSPLSAGSRRVLRGGNWATVPSNCRSAHRVADHPLARYLHFGFRVVLVAESVRVSRP